MCVHTQHTQRGTHRYIINLKDKDEFRGILKRRTRGKFLVIIQIRDDDELRDVGAVEMGTRDG